MKILDKIKEERVFRVKLSEDLTTINIEEKCDSYFFIDLDKKEFLKFIEELKELHEKMAY